MRGTAAGLRIGPLDRSGEVSRGQLRHEQKVTPLRLGMPLIGPLGSVSWHLSAPPTRLFETARIVGADPFLTQAADRNLISHSSAGRAP
jgi:hypothetical protein